ncbi:MAG: GNAT family N-acetyltransferase [Nibricoccus sp.]
MTIRLDDLSGPEIAAFLEDHLRDMRAASPPESKHALDLAALRRPEISLWTAWEDSRLIGCCALKQLDPTHAEVKSMRVSAAVRRKGIGAALVQHLVTEAKQRGLRRLSLETGAMAFFEPARNLYRTFGFMPCGPFGSYREDPNSVFMTLVLPPEP